MANISLAYVDQESLVTLNAWLMNTMGRSCWVNTAPMPSLEASVLMVKDSLKFDIIKIGVIVMVCLNPRKACSVSSFYPNWSFFNRLVRSLASSL